MSLANYYNFVTVFESTVIEGGPQKLVADPLKIEFLPALPRSYSVPVHGPRVSTSGRDRLLMRDGVLLLDRPGTFVVFTARACDAANPWAATSRAEDVVDRGIAAVAALLGSDVLSKRIYRGWVMTERGIVAHVPHKFVKEVRLPRPGLPATFGSMMSRTERADDLDVRLGLMSRLFSRALALEDSEEKFLLLWTILEVYPMRSTSNIAPISDLLAEHVGGRASTVKGLLGIGRLYGRRCSLVHDGVFAANEVEAAHTIDKLRRICEEVLRSAMGQAYGGRLDREIDDRALA